MDCRLNKTVLASEVANLLGCTIVGKDLEISCVGSFDEVKANMICFSKSIFLTALEKNLVVICNKNQEAVGNATLILADNPRYKYVQMLNILNEKIGFRSRKRKTNIHSSVIIGKNVVIEEGVEIGKGSVIKHNVVIHEGTSIGENCKIHSGVVIGDDGFGFEADENGIYEKFIHFGGVVIGSNVEVGTNSTIANSPFGNTVVSDNTKLDNLVHIAHNCNIGRNVIITACTELSGGVCVGNNVWIGPNASVMQKIEIGDNALVGLGAVITKHVSNDSIVAGNPARIVGLRDS